MSNVIKVATITPTRNNRPLFLNHCKFLISQQTRQPDYIITVDYPPISDSYDIANRYKTGFTEAFNRGCSLAICWEDDDWYSPAYIERMIAEWEKAGRPDLLGLDSIICYHIVKKEYQRVPSPNHSSMATTIATSKVLDVDWGREDNQFIDMHLWSKIQNKKIINVGETISLGIKHGIGKCGSVTHNKWNPSVGVKPDNDYKYLASVVDKKSLEFYKKGYK